jgi:hypothetical protein
MKLDLTALVPTVMKAGRRARSTARSPIFTEIGGQFRSPSFGISLTSCPDAKLVVFGLPKSGNVWLVSMLSKYLGLPAIAPYIDVDRGGVGMCHLPFSSEIAKRTDFVHGVYLLRDLRDIIVSYFYHTQRRDFRSVENGIPNCEFDTIEDFYYDWFLPRIVPYHRIFEHADDYVKRGVPVVRYEKLYDHPKRELERLLDRLGLPIDGDHISGVVEECGIDRLKRNGIHLDVYVPPEHFRKGGYGGYKAELPIAVLRHVNTTFGDLLSRWGYDPNTDHVIEQVDAVVPACGSRLFPPIGPTSQ